MTAADTLIKDLLDKAGTSVLIRALQVTNNKTVREVTLKAASSMAQAAIASGHAEAVFSKLEGVLDSPPSSKDAAKAVLTGVLKVFAELAGSLNRASVLRITERCNSLFGNESHEISSSATLAVAACLSAAIKAGTVTA